MLSFDTLDSPVAGITIWQILAEWFEKVGYKMVFSNVGITQAGVQGIKDLNKYIEQDYKVVTLINDGLLVNSTNKTTLPTHWVVWNGSVMQDPNGYISLELFSWGKEKKLDKTKKRFAIFYQQVFWRNGFQTIEIKWEDFFWFCLYYYYLPVRCRQNSLQKGRYLMMQLLVFPIITKLIYLVG